MDGPEGFDLSRATWRKSAWKEFANLRQKLEQLKELRELVRSLGRGGGKGPLRRAPEQVRRGCRRGGGRLVCGYTVWWVRTWEVVRYGRL